MIKVREGSGSREETGAKTSSDRDGGFAGGVKEGVKEKQRYCTERM